MKNLHLLLTDKPNRLSINTCFNNILELLDKIDVPKINQDGCIQHYNIYITSNEKPKEGEWFLPEGHINPHKLKKFNKINGDLESYNGLCYNISKCKKIILTTDEELIKDGVQNIDNNFLEWFIKNPSCEFVKIKSQHIDEFGNYIDDSFHSKTDSYLYKIIIPKEEPLYEYDWCKGNVVLPKEEEPKQELERGIVITHKQETLEEAAIRINNSTRIDLVYRDIELVKLGAKWQQKRSHSEEEVLVLLHKRDVYNFEANTKSLQEWETPKEWFEQFKKK